MPSSACPKSNRTDQYFCVWILVRLSFHKRNAVANRIVKGLYFPLFFHGAGTITDPDEMKWTICHFPAGSFGRSRTCSGSHFVLQVCFPIDEARCGEASTTRQPSPTGGPD